MKAADVQENELYWYCLTDGTWTAMCRVGDRAYWIGDLNGEPMERLTGEWVGPIAQPGPVTGLRPQDIGLRDAYFEIKATDLD